MSYLHDLTADVRRELDGAGFKGDQIDGIVHAIWPVLRRAAVDHTENVTTRNRIARELADLRDDHRTNAQEIAASALQSAADDYRHEKYGPGYERPEDPAVEDAVDFLMVRVGQINRGEVNP